MQASLRSLLRNGLPRVDRPLFRRHRRRTLNPLENRQARPDSRSNSSDKMAHSNPEQNQADTRLDILWCANLNRAMSTLRKNDDRAQRLERNDIASKQTLS